MGIMVYSSLWVINAGSIPSTVGSLFGSPTQYGTLIIKKNRKGTLFWRAAHLRSLKDLT